MPRMTVEQAVALAQSHLDAGRMELVQRICLALLSQSPDEPRAIMLLAMAAQQSGDMASAAEHWRRAAALCPDAPDVHNNLAVVLETLGRHEEAEAACRKALALQPDFAEAECNLANALRTQGRHAESEAALRRSLAIKPDNSTAWHNLAGLLYLDRRLDEAVTACREALRFDPLGPDVHSLHGILLSEQGHVPEAEQAFRGALHLAPAHPDALQNLGSVLCKQSRIEEALVMYREALRVRPDWPEVHSTLLATSQYVPDADPAGLRAAHEAWEARHGAPLRSAWPAHRAARDPQRPLRLGLVSPDFCRHAVGFFSIGVVEALRHLSCQVFCYANQTRRDDLTERFQAACAAWRDVLYVNDDRLAAKIRDDGIDVLVDLTGHTIGNRLMVFARKPAPIQITWLGYEGTTGLAAIDYLVADEHQIRPDEERWYCERVLRLPKRYLCFSPPTEPVPIGPLPAHARGQVTFACFNNPMKINAPVIALWAEILRRVPNSRLLLKWEGLDRAPLAQRLPEWFAAHGVSADRIVPEGQSPFVEYLHLHNKVDVALDPFPFSGSVTTCYALWMGVPVITLPGQTFASRHTAGHLRVMGLPELIAADRHSRPRPWKLPT